MTDQYAVIGNPVAHSKSPLIHAEFARQTGEDITYAALSAPRDGLRAAVIGFRDAGGRGVNITLPFKHEAWTLATRREGAAAAASAVNTLAFAKREIVGYNTDGIGLVRDLRDNLQQPLAGRRVLIMGAGGAAYGVVEPLLDEHPDELVVANRTESKAAALAAHFEKIARRAACRLRGCGYDALAGQRFDMVINATSAGLADEMPALPAGCIAAGTLAYDMVYGKSTPFLELARRSGARTSDGLGMLVEQAAESYRLWRGRRPATAEVLAWLRAGRG